ncbi:MAG: hypothetical protein KKB20_21860, partial [Proteobacteria bacterium]|nr:hypothetical protein [Pseudomonadota bacterium]
LQTDDLDALMDRMKARGFDFKSPVRELGHLRYVMAMAPDGILLELFQPVPERFPAEIKDDLEAAFGPD